MIGIKDEEFIRGTVPMTKEEIRIISLAKLKINATDVIYDIGAGTGSVSVEAALCCPDGCVYAIEQKEEGIDLIKKNAEKFGVANIKSILGIAPECLKDLPVPDKVFIGGSSGRLIDIIKAVREKNPKALFVANAITLETQAELFALPKTFSEYEDMEMLQVSISKNKKLGAYHMMEAQNPIMICAFGGK